MVFMAITALFLHSFSCEHLSTDWMLWTKCVLDTDCVDSHPLSGQQVVMIGVIQLLDLSMNKQVMTAISTNLTSLFIKSIGNINGN